MVVLSSLLSMWREEPGEARRPNQDTVRLYESAKPEWATVIKEGDQIKIIAINPDHHAYSVLWLHVNALECEMHPGEFPPNTFLVETEVGETWEAIAPLPINPQREIQGYYEDGTLIAVHIGWYEEYVYVTVLGDEVVWLRPYQYASNNTYQIGDGILSDAFARISVHTFVDGWFNTFGASTAPQRNYTIDWAND